MIEENSLRNDDISRVEAIKRITDKAKRVENQDTLNGLCGAITILWDMPSSESNKERRKLKMFDKPKKLKCKVCKGAFEMKAENRYIVAETKRSGLDAIANGAGIVYYDAFDCPFCGCQNITGVRTPKLVKTKEEEE